MLEHGSLNPRGQKITRLPLTRLTLDGRWVLQKKDPETNPLMLGIYQAAFGLYKRASPSYIRFMIIVACLGDASRPKVQLLHLVELEESQPT